MFTTGVHGWQFAAVVCHGLSSIGYLLGRQKTGRILLALGFLLQTLYLVGRGWLGDVFLPNPIVEGPFLLPWCLAAIALIRSMAKPDAGMGGNMALLLLFCLFSLFYAKGMIPPTPKKLTTWAMAFFLSESLAHALFYTGALAALLAMIRKTPSNGYCAWISWAFVVYTVAQVTGAVWCFVGWGNTFSWGSRHMASASIWTFYAALLHLSFISGLRSKGAVMAVAGGVLVFFLSYSGYLAEMNYARIGG